MRPLLTDVLSSTKESVMDITEARECVAQYLREHMTRGPCLDAPSVVREFLTVQFATLEHEEFVVLFLTCQHTLIDAVSMFRGTLAQTSVYPREVVKEALRHNAGAVILAHNHPSGKAEPSRADEHLTQSLKAALALIDVRIIDHFVVAGTSIVSFAERGLL